ncbi:hypothetical protein EDB85DRAFT_1888104 [Lactarius pseudohatsudake]|nr:hypothetical protein EDB85DRAFT_1888104 [Lactarius pseudohatsudake]
MPISPIRSVWCISIRVTRVSWYGWYLNAQDDYPHTSYLLITLDNFYDHPDRLHSGTRLRTGTLMTNEIAIFHAGRLGSLTKRGSGDKDKTLQSSRVDKGSGDKSLQLSRGDKREVCTATTSATLTMVESPRYHQAKESNILREYLEEFQCADTPLRTRIIEKAMAQLYRLRPSGTPFDKKVATKKIQKWFYNHYVRPRRQYIKFTQKWSARNAYYHLHHDEVLERAKEDSGKEPGDRAFLGALQDATTALWNAVSPEDQEEYVDAANEWSENTPPKHIQSRMASSMRERFIQDFQGQLYKTCGIHSIVLTAYESEENNLRIGFNDVNSVLQDGKDFWKFCPDWKSAALWDQWAQFGRMCFAEDPAQEPPKKGFSKTIITPIPLVVNKNGRPELPTVTMHDGYKTKVVQSLLRDYCTAHIRYVTRKPKLTSPWGSLTKDPSSWISNECIPNGFEWKDPSKIQIGEVFHLLNYWRERQDQEDPPRRGQSVRKAKIQQSPVSDEEHFVLPHSQDFDQEDEETSINKSSDDSPNDNDSSDKTDADRSSGGSSHGGDPSEDEGAMESLPLNMSCAAEEVCPDVAGPSCSPQFRGKEMQVGHKPHVAKEEELKWTIKVTEKVWFVGVLTVTLEDDLGKLFAYDIRNETE